MNIGKFAFCVVSALLLVLSMGSAYAQEGLVRASASPFDRQMIMRLDDGTVVITDHGSQKVHISRPSGQAFEVPFADAIAYQEGTYVERQQLTQELNASLTDTAHIVTIGPRRIATDASLWPKVEWCGNVICIEPFDTRSGARHQLLATTASSLECDLVVCPDSPFPCDMGPCSPNKWSDILSFYTGSGAGWGQFEGGGNLPQQSLVEYDKTRWENTRKESCSEKNVAAAEASAVGVATVVSCKAAVTGLGAVGCAAGAVSYAALVYRTNKHSKQCMASYPGIGNW